MRTQRLWMDWLSAVGIEQAAHLSLDSILPAPQLILSSPLSRALSTAIALSGGSGIEVRAEQACD